MSRKERMSTPRKINALRPYSVALTVAVCAPMGGLHAQEVVPMVDVNGGFGLNTASDDWFVGAGISARFPR